MKIENLTQDQVDMLDIMWSLGSTEEYTKWFDSLSEHDQEQAFTLQKMIVLESIDEEVVNDFTLANKIIRKFML